MKAWLGRRRRRQVLVISACLALFAGTLAGRHYFLGGLWFLPAVLLLSLCCRKHNYMTLACLVVVCFGLGAWRAQFFAGRLADNQALYLHKVTLVGIASEDATYAERSQLGFTVQNARVLKPKSTNLLGNVAVKGFGVPAVYRGDTVKVSGKLYPSRGNSLSSLSFSKIQVLESKQSALDIIRRKFAAGMQSALPEPAASFGLGLLIGQRNTLPPDVSDQLRAVGLTHIIAVSGYNLTIIVEAVRRLLVKRSKFQTASSCVALIFIFLAITGTSPPIVRASIISLLGLAAWYYGRNIKPLVLLLVSAAVTVLANPLYLWGNVSWYLSFMAFFGVLVLAPLIIKRYFKKQPPLLICIAIESACAGLMTAPYILHIFGQVSLVALITNVLVVALVPLAMVLGFGAGLAGMLWPAVASWLAWPAKWLLTYMLDIANLFSRLPYALIEQIDFGFWQMLGFYALVGMLCVVLSKQSAKGAQQAEQMV